MSGLPALRARLGQVAAIFAVGVTIGGSIGVEPASASEATYYFEGQTTATAVHLTLTQKPASSLITASLVDDAAGYAASSYDSSGSSEGQAAAFYPGSLVVQGPQLLCDDVFGSDPFPSCPAAPPAYPLLADASYPRSKDAHADSNQAPVGSGPFVLTPARSDATASGDGNDGSTTAASLSLLAGSPAAVTVGAATARSTLHATASGITAHVESTVKDVTIAGMVHIASVHATDDVTVRSSGKPVDHPSVVISGVSVAGQQASIDDSGVHVAGQDGPSLTQKLAQQGVTVRTVGVNRTDAPASARSDATGLAIGFSVPVSGLPYIPNPLPPPFDAVPGVNANGTYVGSITLGAAGAVAAGQPQPGFDFGGIVPPVGVTTTPASSATVSIPGVGPAPAISQPSPTASAPVVADRPVLIRVLLDAFSLRNLYATLSLGMVAMFLGWRGLVGLRRTRFPLRTLRIAGRRG